MKYNSIIIGASMGAFALMFGACSEDGSVLPDPHSAPITKIDSPQKALGATQKISNTSEDVTETQESAFANLGTVATIGAVAMQRLKQAESITSDARTKQALGTIYDNLSNAALSIAANNAVNRMLTLQNISAKTEGPVTTDCAGGGQITTNDEETMNGDTITGKATIVAENCNNGQQIMNGTAVFEYTTVNKSQANQKVNGSLQMGDGDTDAEDSDFVITTVGANETINILSLKLTYGVENLQDTNDADGTISFTANGITKLTPAEGDVETSLMDKFSLVISIGNNNGSGLSIGVNLDGATEHTLGETREYSGFVDFATNVTLGNTITQSINGKSVTEHSPAQCQDGAYQFETVTVFTYVGGNLTAGELNINDNVNIKVIADNQIQVTVNGETTTYTKAELDDKTICNI